jgi:hypothetical protein
MTALILLLCVAGCMGESGEEGLPSPLQDYESLEVAVELLGARYPEATDTAVRYHVLVSVYCSVVHGQPVPREFGMFSPAGDRAVRSRVLAFVLPKRTETSGLAEEERIEAVWGDSWGENVYLQPSDCPGL